MPVGLSVGPSMRILISGAGIAGPTLAYWLVRYGHEPVIVEEASHPRTGGYIVDFWGAGLEVASRMDLLPAIQECAYRVREIRAVDAAGHTVASCPASALTAATGNFVSLPRGHLAGLLQQSLPAGVKIIFGDTIDRIWQSERTVLVAFEHQPEQVFDLLVGADGLHSRTRELVFGPESQFERYLGMKVAAFELEGYRPRDELVYVTFTEVGQQVARFAMRDDRTMFLFTFADQDPFTPPDLDEQKEILRRRYRGRGWECPDILEGLDRVSDLYFDRVSQIDMGAGEEAWSNHRTTLVGDAAWCISLLGGQGSALAMAGSYILAGELRRTPGDPQSAIRRYQQRFQSFVAHKQRAARRFSSAFAPRSAWSLFLRNRVLQVISFSWIARLIAGRGLVDDIDLPMY
jgi:2-polyprenyl-6-methoxyphenol hydroxylase-like FAD-dependent oxidoreductase